MSSEDDKMMSVINVVKDKLTDAMSNDNLRFCAPNICYYGAEYTCRLAAFAKAILKTYDLDIKTVSEADIKCRMPEAHRLLFINCAMEFIALSKIVEGVYTCGLSPLAIKNASTMLWKEYILSIDCCYCKGLHEFETCDMDIEEIQNKARELKGVMQEVLPPLMRISGNDTELHEPFPDLQTEDGK